MNPSAKKVLLALRAAGGQGANTNNLSRTCGPRFGARIMDLRKLGYVIESRLVPVPSRISGNHRVWVYKLVSEPPKGGK